MLFRDVGDFDTPAEPFSDFSSGLRFELSHAVRQQPAAAASQPGASEAASRQRGARSITASGGQEHHGRGITAAAADRSQSEPAVMLLVPVPLMLALLL
eukprot:COSAG01_NODE_57830_length_309_cov_10.380952_1_plen_98_part_10